MKKVTIICGGSAGLGPNFVSDIIAQALVSEGFFVFNSREYESRIRGGHNFNIITFSNESLASNSIGCDLLIALDDESQTVHKPDLNKGAITIFSHQNALAIGQAFKILGLKFNLLENIFKKHNNYETNIKEARQGYTAESRLLSVPKPSRKLKSVRLTNGSEAVANSSVQSGLDFYYAYPMTPATGVLFELASKERKNTYVTVEMESELSVVNAALGSAMTGARVMIGTSGGGFDLMCEALTMSAIASIPIVFYLCQRPGPATGLPTYTAQGDLNIARHSGHGEFPRIVAAPGDPLEAEQLTSDLFYLSTKYNVPAIILSDKHLADSFYTITGKPLIRKAIKGVWPKRFTSYESDENQIADSSSKQVNANVSARFEIAKKIAKEVDSLKPYGIYGKKKSKNLIIGWGSTQGAICDAIKGLDCTFIKIRYLEPIGSTLKKRLQSAKRIIIVENNATAQLASLLAEKTGLQILDKYKILRYDGRPFLVESLAKEIKRRLA